MENICKSFFISVRRYIHTTFSVERTSMLNSIRITVVTVLPIVMGVILKRPDLGMMGFLGGLYATLADVGGAYRTRAFSMSVATLGISLAAFVGTIVGWNVWLAAPLMFLCAFICSMLSMCGNVGSKIGFVIIGIFIIVSGQPASFTLATERWLSFMLGGGWALLLTLWLWPWQPFQPMRDALAAYYQALGNFIDKACCANGVLPGESADSVRWNETISAERAHVIKAHDLAHNFVVSSSSRRETPSALSQLFLLLTLNADRLFDAAIALAESIEIAQTQLQDTAITVTLDDTVQRLSSLMQTLALNIKEGDALDEASFNRVLSQLVALETIVRQTLKGLQPGYTTMAAFRNVLRLQRHVVEEVKSALGHVSRLNADLPSARLSHAEPLNWSSLLQSLREGYHTGVGLLVDNLTPHSLTFRHALRLAISTSLMVAFYVPLNIPNGYWIPLTILFILKPDYGGTSTRAYQRVIGTVLGGVVATVLVATVHNESMLIFILLLIGFIAFAHISGDYGIYVVFLTLFVLIMMDISTHTTWTMSMIRIGCTTLGGVVALLFGYLFWPLWEQERLPAQLARTIRANRAFFHCVMAAYLKQASTSEKINMEVTQQASRRAQVENSNAAAAYQRMLSEPRAKRGDVERFYALVTYNQHFHDRITALATHLRTYDTTQHALPGLATFVEQTEEVLHNLELAVLNGSQLVQIALLGESLQDAQDSFKHVLDKQLAESVAQQRMQDTAHQEAVRTVSFVDSQLNRLAHDVAGMALVDL
jgi:Predicted membrane protein